MNCIAIERSKRTITYQSSLDINRKTVPTNTSVTLRTVSCLTPSTISTRKSSCVYKSLEEEIKPKLISPFASSIKRRKNNNKAQAQEQTQLQAKKCCTIKNHNHSKHIPHNCTCVDCLCNSTIKRPKIFTLNKPTQHSKECICSSCLCEDFCEDATGKAINLHGPDCSCVECLFKFEGIKRQNVALQDESIETITYSYEMPHPNNCECPSCLTSPDSPILLPKEVQKDSVTNCTSNSSSQIPEQDIKVKQTRSVECTSSLDDKIIPLQQLMKSWNKILPERGENSEIAKLLNKIQKVCEEADQLKISNSKDKQQDLERTLYALQRTFEKLQCKCKDMNHKFKCLKHQLKNKDRKHLCSNKQEDCDAQCNAKNICKNKLSVATIKEETVDYPSNCDEMEVTEARRISSNSLLLMWTPGKFSEEPKGYEILVDGLLRSRVYSSFRTCAVVHDLDFKNNIDIAVYAVSFDTRFDPPARAIFEV